MNCPFGCLNIKRKSLHDVEVLKVIISKKKRQLGASMYDHDAIATSQQEKMGWCWFCLDIRYLLINHH